MAHYAFGSNAPYEHYVLRGVSSAVSKSAQQFSSSDDHF
jgi:hypothetical protein